MSEKTVDKFIAFLGSVRKKKIIEGDPQMWTGVQLRIFLRKRRC